MCLAAASNEANLDGMLRFCRSKEKPRGQLSGLLRDDLGVDHRVRCP